MNTNAVLDIAAALRKNADALEELVRQTNRVREAAKISAVDIIARLCDEGVDEPTAIASAAAATGTDVTSVRWAWRFAQSREERDWRRTLPLRVADLTAAGVKDAEIARVLGIPRQQVSRLRRQYQERQTGRAPTGPGPTRSRSPSL